MIFLCAAGRDRIAVVLHLLSLFTSGFAWGQPAPPTEIEIEDLPETFLIPLEPICPDALWPDPGWSVRSLEVRSQSPSQIAALERHLFPEDLDRADEERAGVRTDGVVIIHRGHLIYERYAAPYTDETPHLAWSATKTFTNALIGIAVAEERLSLSDSICDHLRPGWTVPDASCAITVQHLLEMASGLQWRETYEGQSPTASSVLAMLYGEGHADMASFVAQQPLAREPGAAWQYSSGDTNVLSAIAGAVLGPAHGDRFPFEVLLDPLGMTRVTWERDTRGTYVGSSYLWATPRDLARLGLLLLQDGCWEGERLLPEGWVADSTTLADPIRRGAIDLGDKPQGRQIWLNQALPEQGLAEPPWPDVPTTAFAALGHWGQSITVIPDASLVVVRTADDRDRGDVRGRPLKHALDLAREQR